MMKLHCKNTNVFVVKHLVVCFRTIDTLIWIVSFHLCFVLRSGRKGKTGCSRK